MSSCRGVGYNSIYDLFQLTSNIFCFLIKNLNVGTRR